METLVGCRDMERIRRHEGDMMGRRHRGDTGREHGNDRDIGVTQAHRGFQRHGGDMGGYRRDTEGTW